MTEKTYYEKILISSGEVPETGMHLTDKGHIHFFGEKWFCENRDRFVVPEWYLKPVPSPKQEADIIKLLRMKLENEISLNNGDYFLVDLNKVFSLDLSVSSNK